MTPNAGGSDDRSELVAETVDRARAGQMARFVVVYDTPSDVDAFERHYNDVHIPLARRYPDLRR
jgi:hypothetical protein